MDHEPESGVLALLEQCLVGRVGGPDGRLVNIRRLSKWTSEMWRVRGEVEIIELGAPYVGFIFQTKQMAVDVRSRRWFVDNLPLFLDWWSPIGLCRCGAATEEI